MLKKPFSIALTGCWLLVVLLTGSVVAQDAAPRLPLPAGTELQRDVKYFSASGDHYLIFQHDGNLVVYDKTARFVWGVNEITSDYKKAAKAGFNASGVFGLFDAQGNTLWSPGVHPLYAAELTLSPSGALQILGKDKGSQWTSDGRIVEPPSLDLATHLPGTWGPFVISKDRISKVVDGHVEWSGNYTITGSNTLAITYDDGQEDRAIMRVYERQQGPLLVKRLSYALKDSGGETQRTPDQTNELAEPVKESGETRAEAAPVAAVAPDCQIVMIKSNVFYIGVDNLFKINCSGISLNDTRITAGGGGARLRKVGHGRYSVGVSKEGDVILRVSAAGHGLIAQESIPSKRIPDPVARLGGNLTGGSIRQGLFQAQGGLRAVLVDFDYDVSCAVVRFDVVRLQKDGTRTKVTNIGPRYSDEARQLINQAIPGDNYFFQSIKVMCPGEAAPRTINDLAFEIN